jgi:hypothetical protein
MTDDAPTPRDLGRYFALAQVGLEMVAPIVLGLYLDSQLGWAPWGVVGGAVFGLVGGLWHLIVLLNRFDENNRK